MTDLALMSKVPLPWETVMPVITPSSCLRAMHLVSVITLTPAFSTFSERIFTCPGPLEPSARMW